MFHRAYEQLIRFASTGELTHELQEAKAEFIATTGDLFESDPSFERRLSSFLEWYVLDRRLSDGARQRPIELFLEKALRETPEDEATIVGLTALAHAKLSLFEFKKQKGSLLWVTDLLTNEKFSVTERRHPLGLSPKDIFEARLVPTDDTYRFTESFGYYPPEVRTLVLQAIRAFRKDAGTDAEPRRLVFLHRLAYCANRADRYRHVDPLRIFKEALASFHSSSVTAGR